MRCPACSQDTSSNYQFCLQCGADIGPVTQVQRPQPRLRPAQQSISAPSFGRYTEVGDDRSKSSFSFVAFFGYGMGFVLLLLLCGIAVGGVYIYTTYQEDEPSSDLSAQAPSAQVPSSRRTSAKPSSTPVPTPVPTPTVHNVLNQTFPVGQLNFKAWNFYIAGPSLGLVKGAFKAEGGDGNDIQCLVVDELGFENLKNGHAFRAHYDSGKTTTDAFEFKLPPGRYFVVFNNKFSLVSNKVVTAELTVQNF